MVKSREYKQLKEYIKEMYEQKNLKALLKINVNEHNIYFDEMQELEDKIDRMIEVLERKLKKKRTY